jgi:3-deoxy-D-manno-octulosonic-acid transferase
LREDPRSADYLREIDVLLGDTMGEMPFFYAAADVAVVGGSFEAHGGQNFIEACALGTPVIIGPHTFNFSDAVKSALQAQAIVQVQTAAAAFNQIDAWLVQPDQAKHVGAAGRDWVAQHKGATDRMIQAINDLTTTLD